MHWSERHSCRNSSSPDSRTLTACSVSLELGFCHRQLQPFMTGDVNGSSDLRSVPSGLSHSRRACRESRVLHPHQHQHPGHNILMTTIARTTPPAVSISMALRGPIVFPGAMSTIMHQASSALVGVSASQQRNKHHRWEWLCHATSTKV